MPPEDLAGNEGLEVLGLEYLGDGGEDPVKAVRRYAALAADAFLCTHTHAVAHA